MTDQPPEYEELLIEDASRFEPPMPLVVRLRVWHYSNEGRSPANNNAFAALFQGLEEWEVVPLELEGVTGPGAHDSYVPVEVQFRHRVWAFSDPGEHPLADVRRLFYRIAPPLIHEFFTSISSTPYERVIFPVGAPATIASNYTHQRIINKLGIKINLLIVPSPVRATDVQSWLRSCVNTSRDVSTIVEGLIGLYLLVQRGRSPGIGLASPVNWRQLTELLDIRVPDTLPDLQNLVREFIQPEPERLPTPRDIETAASRLARPLQSYLDIMARMQDRLRALENYETLSDQDVFELLCDSNHAQLHWSDVKEAIEPFVELLQVGPAERIEAYNRHKEKCSAAGIFTGAVAGGAAGGATGALALMALLNWWNPAGWVATTIIVGGGVVGATCGGRTGHHAAVSLHGMFDAERGKAFGENDRIREVTRAVKAQDDCFNEGREAILKVHHRQLMNMNLDDNSFPDHERHQILDSHGIRVAALRHQDYREVLVGDRLRVLRMNHNHVDESVKRMLKDANLVLKTTEKANEEATEEDTGQASGEAPGGPSGDRSGDTTREAV